MLHKLEQVEARYEELNRKLSDPETLRDQDLLRKYSQEHHEIGQIVEVYRELKALEQDIAEYEGVVRDDDDPELVELARGELPGLLTRRIEFQDTLKLMLVPKDPLDRKNVILEVRAGTGGDEASLFAGDLLRMYTRYAERKGWITEILSCSEGTQGGFKEVVILLSGSFVYSHLKYESGVHRVQRVPNTETQGRIHTSAVTVAVLPEAEAVEVDIQDSELRFDVYRSSGPGGQSVNTTDSAVRVTHLPTGLVVTCQDEKSQHKNKAKGLKILASRLLDLKQQEEHELRASERRSQVKTGDRSEKIRTYNFPQDRLTDHRLGLTLHNLPGLLAGDIEELVVALRTHFQAELLKQDESIS